ncbi:MAG: hypothetical protein CMO61_14210 [Verrucomicrobiales bacterium]|nr:hypothetical protein [Verrucomicrobiales bacterium]
MLFGLRMKIQMELGLIAGSLCLAIPFLSRLPRGSDWVAQYLPDEGHFISGTLLFGAFAIIPAIVVFTAALISKSPFYLPVVISALTAIAMLAYWHHDNDLAADAQAAISLIFIPIFAACFAIVGGAVGVGLQSATQLLRKRTEQNADPNA